MTQSSPMSDVVSPANASEVNWHMDARIESALAWAEKQELGDITLAIPYPVPDATLRALTRRRGISSLIVNSLNASALDAEAAGAFLPIEYSWRLPERASHRILYIGTRSKISARMIKASLRRGVREIAYWDIDRWILRSTALLAIDKVRAKVYSHLSTTLLVIDRARAKLFSHLRLRAERSGSIALLMLWLSEASYRRGFGRALQGAPTIERLHPMRGRVVLVCPTLVAGGAERQIVNTATGLRRQGITDITVLVANLFSRPGNDFFHHSLLAAGVQVREIGGAVSSEAEWERYRNGATEMYELGRVRALLRGLPDDLVQDIANLYSAFREIRPELVHSWLDYSNVRAGYAAVLAGVPRIVVSGRNVSPIHFPYILESHMRAAYQGLATRPEIKFVNNSTEGAADYAAWIGVPPSRIRVVRNGIDSSQTRRAATEQITEFRRSHGVPSTGLLVGGMFRFSDEKRPLLWLQTAVELTARRDDVYCLLFGEGPCLTEMERYLAEVKPGERIQLTAPTPDSTLALSAFDVLLLTSQWEGTPNVAIEAQAVDTPVVVTGGGGAREAVHDGATGVYVEQPTVDRLATTVVDLLSQPREGLPKSGAGPRFVAERFGLERMIKETLEIYDICGP